MMEIGAEISQKIRSAITAKLIEQGAYVDDELPDYIMVMVANKKTQKQMADDLSLFLGINTDKFTVWLHGLLKKLQSINTDEPGDKHKPKDKDKHKGEKKKHKTLQGVKEKAAKSTDGEKQIKSSDGEKEKTQKKKTEEKVETSSTKLKAVEQAEDEQHDEINISENTDEFNEENTEAERREQIKSSGKPPPTNVAKSEKSAQLKKSSKTANKSKTSSTTSKHKGEVKESRKKPTSFVASVKRKYEEVDEEEEYDPANPAVGSVASIVRGPQRKSSVPKALQANKSLLMKAVTEAEKSVTKASKKPQPKPASSKPPMRSDRQPLDLKTRLKTAAGLGLISRSRRSELQAVKHKIDTEFSKNTAKKPRKSSGVFENITYTIKNQSVSPAKSPPKKTPPKPKAPAVAPSRVAASALREMGHTSKVVVKKESKAPVLEEDEEEDEGSDVSSAVDDRDISDDSVNSVVDDSNSDEEVEIEITDRAAQTTINMRDRNFQFAEMKHKSSDKDTQTELKEIGRGESCLYKLSKDKMEEIDNNLLNLFIENLLPFEFIENDPFRMFAKTLEPKYHFPKRKKLITEVGMLYNTVKDLMKSEMSGNQSVSFTHNSWTNIDGELYDTVTVHFVTEDWKLRSAVLKSTEISAHDHCEGIAEHLDECRVKWNLSEPVLVTDDSKTEHIVVKMLGWKGIVCFGSCIHTVIRRSLKERDICHFVEQGRKLVVEVLGNSTVMEMFERKKQLLLSKEVQGKRLTSDDGETWNSMLEMMTSLAEQTPALHAAVMDSELTTQGIDLRNMLYTFSQHASIESLVKVLNTFKTATEILTNTENPTLQKVIPIFVKLDKVLEIDNEDNTMIKNMKSDIRHEIKHFLDNGRKTCLLACLVHPHTKQMAFVSEREKEDVKSVLFHDVQSQCEKEFKKTMDAEGKFVKSKKGSQRQTKAMSEVVDDVDVRRVVVNKDCEDNGAHVNNDVNDEENKCQSSNSETYKSQSSNGETSDDEADESIKGSTGDGDRNMNRASIKTYGDNETAGPSVELGSGDVFSNVIGNSSARNVIAPSDGSDSTIQLTNLSITVENDWLDDVICASDDPRSPEETAKIELNLYMAEPASSKSALAWWQEKQVLYPHIASVAKRVLAIPASSLAAREIFSLDRKKDCKSMQIKAEHIDMMLFLKQNKALYETE